MDFENMTDNQLADVIMDEQRSFDDRLSACEVLEGRRRDGG